MREGGEEMDGFSVCAIVQETPVVLRHQQVVRIEKALARGRVTNEFRR